MSIVIVPGASLTDAQFKAAVAARRAQLKLTKGQYVIGCPLCAFDELPGQQRMAIAAQQGN